MPLDDALAFVARNFNQYMNDSKDRRTAPPRQDTPLPKERVEPVGRTLLTQDTYISGLLNMATVGKPLKVLEVDHLIDALIKYKNEIDTGRGKSYINASCKWLQYVIIVYAVLQLAFCEFRNLRYMQYKQSHSVLKSFSDTAMLFTTKTMCCGNAVKIKISV